MKGRRVETGGRKSARRGRQTDPKGRLRPLHTPTPVTVQVDEEGRPSAVGEREAGRSGRDRSRVVLQIRESWRIDDEWWRRPVSRLYFEVVLEDGGRAVLYRDRVRGGWYRQGG